MPLPSPVSLENGITSNLEAPFNLFLKESFSGLNGTLKEAWDHHINSGGSRLRANISLSVAKEAGLPRETQFLIAAAVEILHQSSLLLDDIQDRDGFRRGKPSVWNEYGEGVAINLSLFLITKAYSFVSEIKRTETSLQRNLEEYLSEAINETVLGQQADLESLSRGWSLERYQEISGAKSGTLFGLPFLLVMSLQGETQTTLELCKEIASLFGLAYQLMDDYEDQHSDNLKMNGPGILKNYHLNHWTQGPLFPGIVEDTLLQTDSLFKKLPNYTQTGNKLFRTHISSRIEAYCRS